MCVKATVLSRPVRPEAQWCKRQSAGGHFIKHNANQDRSVFRLPAVRRFSHGPIGCSTIVAIRRLYLETVMYAPRMQANPRMEIVRRSSQAKSIQSICDLLCIRPQGYCRKACDGMARQWLKALSL